MGVDLKGKTCVVTGSAKSIGLGIAEMYAGLGAKVAMIDLNPEVVKQAERLAKAGHAVRGLRRGHHRPEGGPGVLRGHREEPRRRLRAGQRGRARWTSSRSRRSPPSGWTR